MKQILFNEEQDMILIYKKIAEKRNISLSEWIRKTLTEEAIKSQRADQTKK